MNIRYPLLLDGGLSNELESQGCDLNHKLWSAKCVHFSMSHIKKSNIFEVQPELTNL